MRILHIFDDWKWTGPAEPTARLCLELQRRGHEVTFACKEPPSQFAVTLRGRAEELGLHPLCRFSLARWHHLADNLRDMWSLSRYLTENRVQILHTHSSHAHLLGALAARRGARSIRVVRTHHQAEPLKAHLFSRLLFGRLTDGLVLISERAKRADVQSFSLPEEKVATMCGAVDLAKYRPQTSANGMRTAYGIGPADVVVGIVARAQRHRRFDVLLQAMALAVKEMPNLKLLVVGRGTHIHEVAVAPAERLGLSDCVIFSGYRTEDYVATLAVMDLKVFLVPGSDGTCRAVCEAMAMGKPIVAARRGILPEIVEDGVSGYVIDDTPQNLADAILVLARDPQRRREMGQAANAAATERFSFAKQADAVETLYQNLLGELDRDAR